MHTVSFFKYPWLTFTSDLNWSPHTGQNTSKAFKNLVFWDIALHLTNSKTKRHAYEIFIRPALEYPQIMWYPHQIHLINATESVQNRAARFFFCLYWLETKAYMPYRIIETSSSHSAHAIFNVIFFLCALAYSISIRWQIYLPGTMYVCTNPRCL